MNEDIKNILEEIDKTEESLSESQDWIELKKAEYKLTGKSVDPIKFALQKTNARNMTRKLHSLNRKLKYLEK